MKTRTTLFSIVLLSIGVFFSCSKKEDDQLTTFDDVIATGGEFGAVKNSEETLGEEAST